MIFKSIKEIYDYIPKCVICGKDMELCIQDNSYRYKEYEYINFTRIDDKIVNSKYLTKYSNNKIEIDIESNKVISGGANIPNYFTKYIVKKMQNMFF